MSRPAMRVATAWSPVSRHGLHFLVSKVPGDHAQHASGAARKVASGLLLAVFGAIAFSGKAIIVKLAYRYGVDAVTLIMYRMLFALPLFALMAWWSSRGKPALKRRDWIGVLAPIGTPPEVVARLSAEMVKIIHSPDFRKRMDDIGAEPVGNTPAQMAQQIADDTRRFAQLVKDNKVTVD